MPKLVWDKMSDRVYESGLDKGVLYLPDGSAVPWNGLTSVIEQFDKEVTSVYFDGMKINDVVTLGDFSATMKAVTYPDEFIDLEGVQSMKSGVYLNDQRPKPFGLCYRTQFGNAVSGDVVGYKIHILYNVTAIPNEKAYATMSDDPNLVEFEWTISAVPEELSGFRPTAHFTINSLETDPLLMEDLEAMLYGSTSANAALIPMTSLFAFIRDWYRIKIIDNADGSWTAVSDRDEFIQMLTVDKFQLLDANAVYLTNDTYLLSDTFSLSDVPLIKIVDNGDGTWTASTDQEVLIDITDEGSFIIYNANIETLDSDRYEISDSFE